TTKDATRRLLAKLERLRKTGQAHLHRCSRPRTRTLPARPRPEVRRGPMSRTTSRCALRKAAGLLNVSATVLPFTLAVRRKLGPWPGSPVWAQWQLGLLQSPMTPTIDPGRKSSKPALPCRAPESGSVVVRSRAIIAPVGRRWKSGDDGVRPRAPAKRVSFVVLPGHGLKRLLPARRGNGEGRFQAEGQLG